MKFRFQHYFTCFLTGCSLVTIYADALVASIKNAGLANAGVAYPLDSVAAAYNPAGMIEVGDRHDLGISLAHYEGKTRIHDNPFPGVNGTFNAYRTKNFYPPSGGLNFLFNDCTMALGISVYEDDFLKTSYSRPFKLLGTCSTHFEYVHYTAAPTFAFKLGNDNSFGISLNAEVQRLRIRGLEKLRTCQFSNDRHYVTNKGYDISWGVSATFGWLWHVTDCLSLGFTFQTPSWMQTFEKYRGFVANHGKINPPPYVSAGLAWNVFGNVTVVFDVQHIWWDTIYALKNPLQPNFVDSRLGERDGAGFGWRNQTFYRIGAEYAFNDEWTFRMGYRYGKSPIRRSETVTNQLTMNTVEHFMTAGATWDLNCGYDVSLYMAHGFENKIKGKDSIPEFFGGGESDIQQQIDVIGLSIGLIF